MRHSLKVVLGAAALGTGSLAIAFAGGGIASAGSSNHVGAGVPFAANCEGQTAAFLAQGNFREPGPGLGNWASQAGISVTQLHAGIVSYCATGIVP
jgi:hypothetical protein